MVTARLSSKGQITLPHEIRRAFHLNPGDEVEFLPLGDGTYVVGGRKQDVRKARGMIKVRRSSSLAAMQRDVADGWGR